MVVLKGHEILEGDYGDGNRVVGAPNVSGSSLIEFRGSGCVASFGDGASFQGEMRFRGDDSRVHIGDMSSFRGKMSLGLACEINIGHGMYCGESAFLTTAEGANITLGNDLLISDRFQARADDSHPIYDGVTGTRLNHAQSITVGDHVWIGADVILLPGSNVGAGSVLGIRSMVTKSRPIPENSLAVGSPAKVQRANVVWVRKHLQLSHDVDESIAATFSADVNIADIA